MQVVRTKQEPNDLVSHVEVEESIVVCMKEGQKMGDEGLLEVEVSSSKWEGTNRVSKCINRAHIRGTHE